MFCTGVSKDVCAVHKAKVGSAVEHVEVYAGVGGSGAVREYRPTTIIGIRKIGITSDFRYYQTGTEDVAQDDSEVCLGQNVVIRLEPVVEPARPELGHQDRGVGSARGIRG